MTERLVDISAREAGVRELGVVLNAVRSIAASRAQQAREALLAVDSYSAELAGAIGAVLRLTPQGDSGPPTRHRTARVVFGAEEGFAGTFTERVLKGVSATDGGALFLVGSRAVSVAAERGLLPRWTGAMSSHVAGIPKLADRIATALYAGIASGEIDRIEAIHASFRTGQAFEVRTELLLPLDEDAFRKGDGVQAPLLELAPLDILNHLASDYLHAQLCRAALHAFAAENEARVEAMASARREIERQLEALQTQIRQVRQEQITDEIIELAAGTISATTSR
ncbi:MAG: F0F1 ATP synthase subunit gamma [Devosia sp.]|nr:F0F1 ATP synthase subunit gamma [Devosia sp.]